jgi:hypothetical protein
MHTNVAHVHLHIPKENTYVLAFSKPFQKRTCHRKENDAKFKESEAQQHKKPPKAWESDKCRIARIEMGRKRK